MKSTAAVALAAVGMLALVGCGSASGASDHETVNIVGYSVLDEANQGVEAAFRKTPAGRDVTFKESYGASGDQSRAVAGGLAADEVHLSLEPDVTRLVDAGLVDGDWKQTATHGICSQSIVVFAVRKGNPKHITTWADLVKPGVGIVTPNPASSGSAKWNLLAAYGSARTPPGDAERARSYMEKFFDNVVAMPDSGRDATTAFTGGTGDVLLSYENEAILNRQDDPSSMDYVVPDTSLRIDNSCALLKGASDSAKKWLAFQTSRQGQRLYAETGYRPLTDVGKVTVKGATDPGHPFPRPRKLLTIGKDFGGWPAADRKFFGDAGILTRLQAEAGQ